MSERYCTTVCLDNEVKDWVNKNHVNLSSVINGFLRVYMKYYDAMWVLAIAKVLDVDASIEEIDEVMNKLEKLKKELQQLSLKNKK